MLTPKQEESAPSQSLHPACLCLQALPPAPHPLSQPSGHLSQLLLGPGLTPPTQREPPLLMEPVPVSVQLARSRCQDQRPLPLEMRELLQRRSRSLHLCGAVSLLGVPMPPHQSPRPRSIPAINSLLLELRCLTSAVVHELACKNTLSCGATHLLICSLSSPMWQAIQAYI